MSRQKNFLALVGDLDAVDYKNIAPSDKQNDDAHLANIHRYVVDTKRVGNYEQSQETAQDAAEVPAPFTTDVRDEVEVKLKAQVDAAIAALEAHRASKSEKPAEQSSTEPGPSQQEESNAKPMTINEQLDALMRIGPKITCVFTGWVTNLEDRTVRPRHHHREAIRASEEAQDVSQDATEVAEPSSSDARAQEVARLKAQIDEANARLKELEGPDLPRILAACAFP